MKIITEKPPIYDSIVATFGIIPHGVVYTYGDAIYNPDHLILPTDVLRHEEKHSEQQNRNDIDAALWWGKFLREPEFRIDQEAQAYGAQYAYICKNKKSPFERERRLKILAEIFAGPLYGKMISVEEAKDLILKYAKL